MELQFHPGPALKLSTNLYDIYHCSVAYRGGFGVFKPPRNSEVIGGVLDRMGKKN